MSRLAHQLRPCGPIIDAKAAERAHDILAPAAQNQGWAEDLAAAWPALAPVFGASPYLAGLARRTPARLGALLAAEPEAMLRALLDQAHDAGDLPVAEASAALRQAKRDAHLLIALADLGGVWGLDAVTGALTRLADTTLAAALRAAARAEVEAGRLQSVGEGPEGPVPGYFGLAMGKQGAFELNYSSDIDFSVFYHPDRLPVSEGVDHSGLGGASRISAEALALALARSPWMGDLMRPFATRDKAKGKGPGVRAKTGTLNFVSGLAGFVDTPRPMVFAIFAADTARRDSLSGAERERPSGGPEWTRRARAMQGQLIERWAALHGG